MIHSNTDLLSAGILNRFLVFRLKLVRSLISPSFVVDTKLIQYLFQELLKREGEATVLRTLSLYKTKTKNKYGENLQQKE